MLALAFEGMLAREEQVEREDADVPGRHRDHQSTTAGAGAASSRASAANCPRSGHQLGLGAALDDAAAVEHDDLVGPAHGREPVGDHDRRAPVQQAVERLLDQHLGRPVDVRGRLVEDQDARVGEQRAADRDQLALARGEAGAALAHGVLEALREARGDAVEPDRARGLARPARRSRRARRSAGCRRCCPRTGTDPAARRRAAGGSARGRSRAGRCRPRAPRPRAGRRSARRGARASTCRRPTCPRARRSCPPGCRGRCRAAPGRGRRRT